VDIYERVRQILRSPPTQRIDFHCQGVPVNPRLFASVINAVGNIDRSHGPTVSVIVDPFMRPGVAAEYQQNGNIFRLRDNVLRPGFDEVTLVHEAVHCGFDLQQSTNWRWFGQEACAYIAGALYARYAGVNMEDIERYNPIYSIAGYIARQLGPVAIVTWEQYLPLRTQLRTAAITPGNAYNDGLNNDSYNYPNNG
jgi:hypothetical protein